MDIEFDCDFRFADTDVAVCAGWVQYAWDQQLLPEVGTLVQEDLEKRRTKTNVKTWEKTTERAGRILL